MTVLQAFGGGLIVSCQPVPGGPFDTTDGIVAFARAAQDAGACGLRIEGAANVAAVVRACRLPVIGLVKRDLPGTQVRITPLLEDVAALVAAGAPIVAVDATQRDRPVAVAALLAAVRAAGRIAMADCATMDDASAAVAAGAQCAGSTLSGYVGGRVPPLPDLALVRAMADGLGVPVLAEGRYNSPALAAAAIAAGAHAVVVGSAITRPEHVTAWFREAIEQAANGRGPVLAFDIGGTKTLAALVQNGRVLDRRTRPTDRCVGSAGWVDDLAAMAEGWRYEAAAVAATGMLRDGVWSALNLEILDVPAGFPLGDRLAAKLGMAVTTVNDAQAAAWGEYRHGAGRGCDMVFVTVSSGVGGGVVTGGRLLHGARGLSGSLGQLPVGGRRLEERASGFAIAAAARAGGHAADTLGVFTAATQGEPWAEAILTEAAAALANGLTGLQATIDPECIVVGGGVGLAAGFLDRVRAALKASPLDLQPDLRHARLGADAGVVGAADLASSPRSTRTAPNFGYDVLGSRP